MHQARNEMLYIQKSKKNLIDIRPSLRNFDNTNLKSINDDDINKSYCQRKADNTHHHRIWFSLTVSHTNFLQIEKIMRRYQESWIPP